MTNTTQKILLRDCVLAQKGSKPVVLRDAQFEDSVPYLDINTLETGQATKYTHKDLGTLSSETDVLVVWDGSRSGLAFKGRYGAIGSTIMSITPILFDSNYLYYYIKSYFELLNGNTTGTGIPHVNADLFFNLEIPYVPLEDQKKIAQELEDNIRGNVNFLDQQKKVIQKTLSQFPGDFVENENILKSLHHFRQSMLQKAVSGELTEVWRKKNLINGNLKPYKLEEVSLLITDGEHSMPLRLSIKNENLLLSARNIREGFISYKDVDYISDIDFERASKRCSPSVGDILMVCIGATIGRCAIVKEAIKFVITRNVALIRVDPELVLNEYILMHLQSYQTQNWIDSVSKGDAQPALYLNKIKQIPVVVPVIEEQQEIIRQATAILEVIEELHHSFRNSISYANQLQLSFVNKTFETALIGADLDLDSFEKIVQKIKAEKIKLQKEKVAIIKKQAPLKNKMRKAAVEKSSLEIEDALKENNDGKSARDAWKESKYEGDIDAFYESIRKKVPETIGWKLKDENTEVPQSILFLKNQKNED
jgi:type I restriction enzyme S subunit